ncbi:DUF748 domain-containing protein, partial [bacterium]|nr:DUF748 domain-containing protein [bacterium]
MTPEENKEPTCESEQPSPSHHRRRKLLGVLLAFLLLLVGLVIGTTYFVYIRYLDPVSLKLQIERQVSAGFGVPVSIGKISLDFPTVKLFQVKIGTLTEPIMLFSTIEAAAATPEIWSLFQGNVVFENLTVSSVSMRLTRNPSGKIVFGKDLNKPEPERTTSGKATQDGVFPLQSFDASEVSIVLDDQLSGRNFELEIAKIDLSVPISGKKSPIALDARLNKMVGLSAKGFLNFPVGLEVEVKCSDFDLERLRSFIPKNFVLPEGLVRPKAKSKVSYNFNGELSLSELTIEAEPNVKVHGNFKASSFSPLTASGAVKIHEIPATQVWAWVLPFLPPTQSSFKFLSGKTGLEGKFEIASGAIKNDNWKLNLERICFSNSEMPIPIDEMSGVVSLSLIDKEISWSKFNSKFSGLSLV